MIRVDELLEEVRLLHEGRRYQEMIVLLNAAILEDNAHPDLYLHRAIALSYNKNFYPAIDDLTAAIALRPDFFRAYLNRGITWSQLKKEDKAIGDFTKAIQIRPQHASTYGYMGDEWSKKKAYDTAIEYYDKGIELNPENMEMLLQRGTAWMELKEYDKAADDYSKVINLQPDNASAHTNLGNAWFRMQEYDKAIRCLNRSVGLRLVNGRAYYLFGLVYEAMKEYDLASMYFKRSFFFNFDGARLLEVFRHRFPAPYIVKSISSATESNKGADSNRKAEANFSTMEWLIPYCKSWDRYLDQLQLMGYPDTEAAQYHSLEAVVNYYMGNSIAAYRIFDTQFDSDEHPYPMSLRDQYYLVLSAVDFKEPDNGLAFALDQCAHVDESDAVSCYYAGQLYLLHDDLDKALHCFDLCGDFLPALYGKFAVYKLMENKTAMMDTVELIAAAEGMAGRSVRFLNGIEPLFISADTPFESSFSRIMERVHFFELPDEIGQVRDLLGRSSAERRLEFHELVRMD